jgi:pyruvate/2-oxoglutarate dehydrogenase complex dihydrolipoamide dehydrogenase (E3) component
MIESFDVAVIGGGTAGLVTASGCARLGRRVAMIEREALGGECLWTGCVPTKALVATARLIHSAAHADRYGLKPHRFEVSPAAVMESMRVTQRITEKHDDPERFRKLGIDVIFGEARFVSSREIVVGERRLTARDIVIATGSRTAVPNIPGLLEHGFIDHASFLRRDHFPRSVVMIGGGYIGTEFAQLLSRFGSEVTLVGRASRVIAREDQEISDSVASMLAEEGVRVLTGAEVTRVEKAGESKRVTVRQGATEQTITAEEVFVAAGREGRTDGLDLSTAGVALERSFVKVNDFLETSAPRIWACGDIHGKLLFTHVAAYEAVKLVRNMLFPGRSSVNYDHAPWAVFTDPEVSRVGLTEEEARLRHGDSVRAYRIPIGDVDRAVVDRTTRGLVKIVCDRKGLILGGHALCSNASSLIGQIVIARRRGMRIGELAQVISPYPSMSDAIQKSAAQYYEGLSSGRLGTLARRLAAFSQER